MPHLRTTAGKDKVKICWASPLQYSKLEQELDRFRGHLAVAPIAAERATEAVAIHE